MDTFPRSFFSHVRTSPPGHYGSYLGCWSSFTIFLRVIWLPPFVCRGLLHLLHDPRNRLLRRMPLVQLFNGCVCVFDSSSSVPPWTHDKLRSKVPEIRHKKASFYVVLLLSALGVFVDSCALTSSANEGLIFANSCMACLPSMLVTFHVEIYNMAMYQTSKMFK